MAYRKSKKFTQAKNRKMGDSKTKETTDTVKGGEVFNDPRWYIRNGQLASDVGSLSFNTALGSRCTLAVDNQGDWNATPAELGVPGVLSINWVPSVGVSEGGYSPINIAAKNIYANIRSKNSGGKNYDAPDLMMYIVAMDSIYSLIQHLQRAYGAAHVYSQLNRYVGDGYLNAMGFDANDVRGNLAQFRAAINMLVVKASAYAVPMDMPLFERHAWMSRCVFSDANLEKAQIYVYRPIGFYKYIEGNAVFPAGFCAMDPCAVQVITGSSGAEMLETIRWTTAQWISYAEALLAQLVNSEDIAIMSGDIIKAYGDNLFKLVAIPDDYALEVGYSDEVLDQIHNTVCAGALPRTILDKSDSNQVNKINWASFDVAQDPNIGDGAILSRPQFANCKQVGIKHILDLAEKTPTAERVIVASRNMVAGDVWISTDGSNVCYANLKSCGSDICLFCDLWDFTVNAGGNWVLRKRAVYRYDGSLSGEVPDIGDLSVFTKFPIGYYFTDVTPTGAFENIFGQVDNFTVIDRSALQKLHESAILSLLGVPV